MQILLLVIEVLQESRWSVVTKFQFLYYFPVSDCRLKYWGSVFFTFCRRSLLERKFDRSWIWSIIFEICPWLLTWTMVQSLSIVLPIKVRLWKQSVMYLHARKFFELYLWTWWSFCFHRHVNTFLLPYHCWSS